MAYITIMTDDGDFSEFNVPESQVSSIKGALLSAAISGMEMGTVEYVSTEELQTLLEPVGTWSNEGLGLPADTTWQ